MSSLPRAGGCRRADYTVMAVTPIAERCLIMTKKSTGLGADPPGAAEAEEFRAAMRGVKPLVHALPAASAGKSRPVPMRRKPRSAASDNLDELMPLIATADGAEANAALSFQRSGVRIQVMRRLKRGLIPVGDELDLHGLTQTAARDALATFIVQARDSGHRCVRVIHGKGYRSGARGPVLKTAVNLWLRRHSDVMAFASARAIDGGTGAVYVLLRG
jgi:DNA-nicking Smr family endonuclease